MAVAPNSPPDSLAPSHCSAPLVEVDVLDTLDNVAVVAEATRRVEVGVEVDPTDVTIVRTELAASVAAELAALVTAVLIGLVINELALVEVAA